MSLKAAINVQNSDSSHVTGTPRLGEKQGSLGAAW